MAMALAHEESLETSATSINSTAQPQEQASLTPFASPSSSPKPLISSPWDVERYTSISPYRCLASILKRCGKILALSISDTGLVYVGSESKSIRVWKIPGFVEFSHLKSSSGIVKAILVSSDDGLIFSAHSDNKIRVWGSSPAHARKGTLPSFKDCLIKTYWSRPKTLLIRRTPSTNINSKGSTTYNKIKHSSTITSMAYNPLGKLLYSASLDRTIKVWSISEMKCIETIQAHDDDVNALVLGSDGLLFSGSDDATVKVWRKSLRRDCYHGLILNLQVQHSPVKALALSCDGETEENHILYAGCSDGYVHYWKKGELSGYMNYCGYLRGHSHTVLSLAAVDTMVISGSADTSIRVWRRSTDGLSSHRCVAVLSGHIAPVNGVAAKVEDDHGCLVYSGSLDGSVKLWWVWRGGCRSGGESRGGESRGGFVGDEEVSSWADYFEISRTFGSMQD